MNDDALLASAFRSLLKGADRDGNYVNLEEGWLTLDGSWGPRHFTPEQQEAIRRACDER